MAVCSNRGLLAGVGRDCWLVDHGAGALGAWRVAGVVSGTSTGTTGVVEEKERAGFRRATVKTARRSTDIGRD